MQSNMSVTRKRNLIRLSSILIDGIFSRVRPLLVVFHLLVKAFDLGRYVVLLLANEYLKSRLGFCGDGVRLNGRMHFLCPSNIHIGDNVHINENAFLRGEGGISIGSNCHISRNLVVYSINHNYEGDALPYDEVQIRKPVSIGSNVWIGMNVVIKPGVTIGDGAIIGMGTTVRNDVESCAIVVGPQCEVIKYRNREHYEDLCRKERYSGTAGIPL